MGEDALRFGVEREEMKGKFFDPIPVEKKKTTKKFFWVLLGEFYGINIFIRPSRTFLKSEQEQKGAEVLGEHIK